MLTIINIEKYTQIGLKIYQYKIDHSTPSTQNQ